MGWLTRPMTPRRREWWKKVRARGKWPFVLLYGVLFWGLLVAVWWCVFFELWQVRFDFAAFRWAGFCSLAVYAFIAFPVGGFFVGLAAWYMNERQYRELENGE